MKPEMDLLVAQILPDNHHTSSPYTYTKPKAKPTLTMILLIIASFVSFAFTVGLMFTLFFGWNQISSFRYSVVIDAGSSGSRIHVFRYQIESGKPVFDFGEENYHKKKLTPGLSSYADNPEEASKSVQQLVDFAKEIVPEDMLGESNIRLMATAGMRLLDEATQKKILDVTRGVLTSSGFNFTNEWASVISGSDEGIYAWVIANYALGSLGGDSSPTTGIVELGGASAQVTFMTSEFVPPESSGTVSYGGVTYNLYSHSFLHLGKDEAYTKLWDTLRKSGEGITNDPCTPKGYIIDKNSLKNSSRNLAEESSLAGSLQAAGDFEKCRKASYKLLKEGNENCLYEHCSIGSTFTPDLKGNFLATSNFYYTSKFFNLEEKDWLSEMIPAGKRFCGEEWSNLKLKYPNEKEEYLHGYCFSSAYIISMLHDSLDVALEDGRIKFADTAGEKNIPLDWALGAFIINTPTTTSDDSSKSRKRLA